MTVGQFEQLVGAAGDVAELEYIAALHQTGELRRDASLQANDIRLFLSSRYGIMVTEKEVVDSIMEGLGGGGEELAGDGDFLDLMEIVAILFIPTLRKAAQQHRGTPLPTNVVPVNAKLLETVWKIMIQDGTGSEKPKVLTKDLIKRLLVAYGESALEEDDELVESMLQACKTSTVKAGRADDSSYFTLEAFADALTSDVQLYDLHNEVRLTTNIEDALLTPTTTNSGDDDLDERLAMSRPLKRVHTLPQIDITAENYRSKVLIIFLWANFLIAYFTYVYKTTKVDDDLCWTKENFEYEPTGAWKRNGPSIACQTFLSVISWFFVFVSMAISGIVAMVLGSIGNSMDCTRWWLPVIGATFVLTSELSPYSSEESDESYLKNVSLGLALVAAFYHLSHAAAMILPTGSVQRIPRVGGWLSTSTVFAEMKLKKSAAKKIIGITENALDILETNESDRDNLFQTHYGQALQTYAKRGKQFVPAGGFIWSWKRIIGEKAFASDGIWIPVRLIASNIAQYIVSLWTLIVGIRMTHTIAENYKDDTAKKTFQSIVNKTVDTAVDEGLTEQAITNVTNLIRSFLASNQSQLAIDCNNFTGTSTGIFEEFCDEANSTFSCNVTSGVNYICPLVQDNDLNYRQQLAFLEASGLDSEMLKQSLKEVINKASGTAINSLYPSELYMVVIPAVVATALAFATAVYLASTYIPSVVNTTLKLRCGVIPTLRNPKYAQYRLAPDQVSILTGSLFWGALVSSIVVGGAFGIVVFFFLWQATTYYAQRLVAIVCGLLIISALRILFLQTQRRRLFRSFYREKPGAANIFLLGLEWATFTLTAGFIFARMVKLLLCAGACIGRIDTPFLAPGIGRVGPIELDVYPMVHLKDILIHEAHRHPYIESLGVIYLLKLRYGEKFGRRAGSCWRLLFVYALMPWLHKYRVSARPSILQTINEQETPGEANGRSNVVNMASQRLLQATMDDKDEDLNARDDSWVEMSHGDELPSLKRQDTQRSVMKVVELEKEVSRLKKELQRFAHLQQANRGLDDDSIPLASPNMASL